MKNTTQIILTLLLMFFSCDLRKKNYTQNIKHAIPVNSDLVVQIHDLGKMKTKITSFEWWKELKNTKVIYQKQPPSLEWKDLLYIVN